MDEISTRTHTNTHTGTHTHTRIVTVACTYTRARMRTIASLFTECILCTALQVGPIVHYYQCEKARTYIRERIRLLPMYRSSALECMAAFESTMLSPGYDPQWGIDMIKTAAESCVVYSGLVQGQRRFGLSKWNLEKGQVYTPKVLPNQEKTLQQLSAKTLTLLMREMVALLH